MEKHTYLLEIDEMKKWIQLSGNMSLSVFAQQHLKKLLPLLNMKLEPGKS